MVLDPEEAVISGMGGHSLRFLNDDWNDSISNGEFFTLRWNQSLVKAGSQLGLFKVTYPKDGVVVYELVTNLTDSMDTASCVFTPQGLNQDLYAMWLTTGQHSHPNWTISPPWTPKEITAHQKLHWATPIIIPVVCLLVLYALCLTTCLVYRRRKKAKREKEDATSHQDVDRNGSVVSAITVQTLTEAYDGKEKPGDIWIFTNSSVETDITVGGVEEKDIADVERGEGDVHCIQDEQAIGIGL